MRQKTTTFSNEALALHAFKQVPEIGNKTLAKLYSTYGNFEKAFAANTEDFISLGLSRKLFEEWEKTKNNWNKASAIEQLESEGIMLVAYSDPDYPLLLKEIPDYPFLLYIKGSITPFPLHTLAVVGTRNITHYGTSITPEIVAAPSHASVTIVSGLAYGVDKAAHEAALKHGTRTWAVLGTGVDTHSLYPQAHTNLAQRILENGGALISEYPPGTRGLPYHFVARNRIIAGLCEATLIIECGIKSGALITADFALEQNRSLCAVPGPITSPQSAGTNHLLQSGAFVVTSGTDICELLGIAAQKTITNLPKLSAEETHLLGYIRQEPVYIDTIAEQVPFTHANINATLTTLEMKGMIIDIGGHSFIRNPKFL